MKFCDSKTDNGERSAGIGIDGGRENNSKNENSSSKEMNEESSDEDQGS